MAGKKGQKKRFWSDEEKISICAQTRAPGVSVARKLRGAKSTSGFAILDLRPMKNL